MAHATWLKDNIFSIKMVGTCSEIIKWVETLTEDFEEPKWGWNGELYDEYD